MIDLAFINMSERLKGTPNNPKLCVTLIRHKAHLYWKIRRSVLHRDT